MGVVFRYMSYDDVAASSMMDAQVVGGGDSGSGGSSSSSSATRRRHPAPQQSSSSSSSSSSTTSDGDTGGPLFSGGTINFERTVEFVNDRWKELREKLAEASSASASRGVPAERSTSSSSSSSSSSSKKTGFVSLSLPDWTEETCIQTKGRHQGSWSQIKSLGYFCIYTEFLWWFQLNYHQYCQHHLVQQQQQQSQEQQEHGHRRLPSQHLHHATNNHSEQAASSFLDLMSIPSWMILPNLSSLLDREEWMIYFRRVFLRLKSAAYDYQMTVTLVGFYDAFFALVCPHSLVTKLTQQPYHRALYVTSFLSRTASAAGSSTTKTGWSSSRRRKLSCWSERWAVASDSVLTCLYANLGFFLAVYTYGQYVEYRLYQQQIVRLRIQSQSQSQSRNNNNSIGQTQTTPSRPRSSSSASAAPSSTADLVERQIQMFQQKSSKLILETFARYVGSAVGAGIGSFVWPGYGTIVGMGVGDGLAQLQVSSSAALLPSHLISNIIPLEYLSKAVSTFQTVREQITKTVDDTIRKISTYRTGIESDSTIVLEEDLMCGCCQIVAFSSDPSDPNRAPISSRECSHTICKKCVQQVHLNLVERVHIYTEWISCPICKAPNAFSSHNHLINRSLCSAIGLIERKQLRINQYVAEQQKQQFQQHQQDQQQQQQRELEAAFTPVRHFTPIKMVRSSSPTSISVNSRRSRISQSRSMR